MEPEKKKPKTTDLYRDHLLLKNFAYKPPHAQVLSLLDQYQSNHALLTGSSMTKIMKAVDEMTKPYRAVPAMLSELANTIKLQGNLNTDMLKALTAFTQFQPWSENQRKLNQAYNLYQQHYQQYSSVTNSIPVHHLDVDTLMAVRYRLIHEPEEQPESQIILLDETSRIKRVIGDTYHDHELLYRLDSRDFEEMIAELLRKQQYEVELTKQTRDGGYDLLAIRSLGDIPLRFLVECKRYSHHRKIGVDIIRSFSDVMTTSGNMGMIVTSSYFSPDAIRYKKTNKPYLLHLRDHDDVIGWVKQYVAD